ncbi:MULTISPECIES: FAD-binding protein [Providencia]|uniref:FAD-binding protein n=1 Tax=Providencia TaxID=586 RepID=UPI001C82D926|nr:MULTISPECIES: FAD-binding protein [Providencia]EIU7557065.1 FAD-binding protein [Providencia rettgeri]EJD6400224.1 FAD-binding protein [Providencia rettgeri]MBX6966402.1 electron transfer flavoprotein subunit alpha [Providencia rettgeri]MBX6977322.1 electron transfer flavoprotein subunit alpha [Providencia rettgeri]MBX6993172.1 electron transfer flavoprotein subunit alpha [Providencia rettgeri]
MSKLSTVWVFSDMTSRLPELIGGALTLGEQVNVLTLDDAQSSQAFQLGATHVFQLSGKPDDRIIEDYADTIVTTIKQHGDNGLLLLPNTRRGKLLAARLGARLQAAVSNDAATVTVESGRPVIKHMVYGGLAFGQETLNSSFSVATLTTGTFEAAQNNASLSGTAQTAPWVEPKQSIVRASIQKKAGNSVELDKARLVVSVGRGIGSQENIAIAKKLADTIGAEIACSRPVAENEKWMEHERYVGISNLMLKPELYLAVGISGQIQHMVGANGAQTIVAINKDKNAPIFQFADYGIVGDLFKILPVLTQQLAK